MFNTHATTNSPPPALLHQAEYGECIILLHGLIRTPRSMHKAAETFESYGYQVVNQAYPSRHKKIPELAQEALPQAIAQCLPAQKIHFMTHSLGGILLRFHFSQNALPQLGRVVMLGPPNQGSEVVDKLHSIPGFGILNGPAGQQLGTDRKHSIPLQLGKVDYEVGIIAGNSSLNPFLSALLPGDDDGKVSVERTDRKSVV